MNIQLLEEPELEFSRGRHIDPRFGLASYGPLDAEVAPRPKDIKIGIVGTPETVEGVMKWLEECRREIPAKKARQPNLFVRFPGFGARTPFEAETVTRSEWCRELPERTFGAKSGIHTRETLLSCVDLLVQEFADLVETSSPDVLLCAVPFPLVESTSDLNNEDRPRARFGRTTRGIDFHDVLKARAMRLSIPLQLVLPSTYDESKQQRLKTDPDRFRRLQDPATRAWNFFVALYYKAGWSPWRVPPVPDALTTCFVGVSFYRTDQERLRISMAQVFNERGQGVVVRGGAAELSQEDRQPHLSLTASHDLLEEALKRYRSEHRTLPARVVVHKTSSFTPEEIDGMLAALNEERVYSFDMISLAPPNVRLFRHGAYPPLRGTLLNLDDKHHLLYTRGSVDFFATYPGMYVPWPLHFRADYTEESIRHLSAEILSLTKMNWNNTQFDGREPITIAAARSIGAILRHVPDAQSVAARYSFYM